MDTGKLVPHDRRVREETAEIRGKRYTYLIGEPRNQPPTETVFLIHGFPDLAFGWRHQIPFLMSMGFRVVAPNMLGYAGTARPEDLKHWSMKSIADDVKALADHVMQGAGAEGAGGAVAGQHQIILGGHDWGGMVVWRVVLWHPGLVKAVFSVGTPFQAPNPSRWISLEEHLAAGRLRNFRYQLQLAGPEVEARLRTAEQVGQLLKAAYSKWGDNRGFTTEGLALDNFARLPPPPPSLMSAAELAHYVEQYMRQPDPPLRGGLNWYRVARLNYDEERELAAAFKRVDTPALFIATTRDAALPMSMSAGMDTHFSRLARAEVDTSHWALSEAATQVNAQIAAWLATVLPEGTIRAAL
ncbi:hypothetical protein E4U21_001828 [Claviceps maximensis]|nr:hypothetical protein E4U21_001828 [Claviceps maximensis]